MTNIAVKIDRKRPIGARARRIREPRLLLVSYIGGRDSGVSMEMVCDTLDDLKDYSQPHAPGRRQTLTVCVCVCVCVRVCVRVCVQGLVRSCSE